MSKALTTIEEIIFEAGFNLESLRQEVINNASHSVVEILIERARDELAAELGRDLSDYVIEPISVEMELESLVDEIGDYVDAGSTSDTLEDRHVDEVRELVRQHIQEQDNDR